MCQKLIGGKPIPAHDQHDDKTGDHRTGKVCQFGPKYSADAQPPILFFISKFHIIVGTHILFIKTFERRGKEWSTQPDPF